MEVAATTHEIIANKIAMLYPSLKIRGIYKIEETYVVDIDYDVNIPGSNHNQKWVIENNKAVFLGTIFKQSVFNR